MAAPRPPVKIANSTQNTPNFGRFFIVMSFCTERIVPCLPHTGQLAPGDEATWGVVGAARGGGGAGGDGCENCAGGGFDPWGAGRSSVTFNLHTHK